MKVVFELEDKKQNLDGMIEALNKYHELMNTKDMNITHYEEALKVQDALFQYGLRFASFFVVTQMTFQEGLEVYYIRLSLKSSLKLKANYMLNG